MRSPRLFPIALSLLILGACTPNGVPTPATPPGSPPSVTASAAQQIDLQYPNALAVDTFGNLFIGDGWGMRIYKVTPAGQVSTLARTTYGSWQDNAKTQELPIGQPSALATGDDGSLYVSSGVADRVVRIDPSGQVTTAAGGNGTLRNGAEDLVIAGNGDLIVLENGGERVLRFPRTGGAPAVVVTNAAPVRQGVNTLKSVNRFHGVALDPQGRLIASDLINHRIVRLETDGHLEVISGTGDAGFSGDGGPATLAKVNHPGRLAVDTAGALYLADTDNRRIRRISPDGVITTVAGTDTPPTLFPDNGDNGPAANARLVNLQDLVVDASGNVLFSDSYLKQVRRIDRQGVVTRVAGMVSTLTAQPPYGTETLSLSDSDRRVARALADAISAFDDRIAENAAWWAKLSATQELEALISSGSGVGIFEQTRGTANDEQTRSTTKTLTTRRVDKIVETIETLSRTDYPAVGLQPAKLGQAALKRLTNIRGPQSGREQLSEEQTLFGPPFNGNDTTTLRHTDAQGDLDWQLTASGVPSTAAAPVLGGGITYRTGARSRSFGLKYEFLAAPKLTVTEHDGPLQLTAVIGPDARIQTVVFRSGDRQVGEIRLR